MRRSWIISGGSVCSVFAVAIFSSGAMAEDEMKVDKKDIAMEEGLVSSADADKYNTAVKYAEESSEQLKKQKAGDANEDLVKEQSDKDRLKKMTDSAEDMRRMQRRSRPPVIR